MAKTTDTPSTGQAFDKAALLSSQKYSGQRDLLSALLLDGKSYTFEQVDAAIEKYMKGGA